MPPHEPREPSRVIALIHGIRTYAHWQEVAKKTLEEDPCTKCVTIRYGYFDLFRFLVPFQYFRRRIAERIALSLREIKADHPTAELTIIAHSFGSYIVTQSLIHQPGLDHKRLIICGGIVPDDYPWWLAKRFISGGIRNDCSRLDPWPAFAKACTVGYGAIGTYGANAPEVEDRFQETGHSGYFSETHIRDRWRPFIETGELEPVTVPSRKGFTSWWARPLLGGISFLKLLLPFLFTALLVALYIQNGKPRMNEGKWFPPKEVLEHISNDIKSGNLSYFLPGYALASGSREPTVLREIHLYFDTTQFTLRKLNMICHHRILLNQSSDGAFGQWITNRLYKPGYNLKSFWSRVEVASEPDQIRLSGRNPWQSLINLAFADVFPAEAETMLREEGLTFLDLKPVIVLGVTREQWTFTDTSRIGERWVNLQLTRVTSSNIANGSLSLPDLKSLPESSMAATWYELEVEERGWTTSTERLFLAGGNHRDLLDRLKIFLETYNIPRYEEKTLPKYFRALDAVAESATEP